MTKKQKLFNKFYWKKYNLQNTNFLYFTYLLINYHCIIYLIKYRAKKKHFNLNNTKINQKSYRIILIYYTGYVTFKVLKYVKINGLNPFYHIFSKVTGYFEEINKNTYYTLVPTNESKEIIKTFEELWSEIRDIISSIKNSDDHN